MKNPVQKILKKLIILVVFISSFSSIFVLPAQAITSGPGNTYSDWYFPSGSYQSLEWTFIPVQDPPASLAQEGLLHYYAYNFYLTNSTSAVGGGYAGFQTNGIFNGTSEGQAINFSIWGSNGGDSPSGLINPANSESGSYQIMLKYPWVDDTQYRFQLKEGLSGYDSSGIWWGLWVTDEANNQTTYVGEERVPATINGLSADAWSNHTSMFGEDLHWWDSLNGTDVYQCSDFQNSSMAATDITANGSIKPASFTTSTNSGQIDTGSNGYQTLLCPVTVYSDSSGDVQHNLGYWPSPAPNYLTTIESSTPTKPTTPSSPVSSSTTPTTKTTTPSTSSPTTTTKAATTPSKAATPVATTSSTKPAVVTTAVEKPKAKTLDLQRVAAYTGVGVTTLLCLLVLGLLIWHSAMRKIIDNKSVKHHFDYLLTNPQRPSASPPVMQPWQAQPNPFNNREVLIKPQNPPEAQGPHQTY